MIHFPDQSAVEIQYSALYTAGTVYCHQYSVHVLAVYTGNLVYHVLQLAVYDHTAHILIHSSSIPAVYTADLI